MEVFDEIWNFLVWLWEFPFIQSLLGAVAFWLLVKIIGLSNKSVKWLWITYKEGFNNLIELCTESDNFLGMTKTLANVTLATIIVMLFTLQLETMPSYFTALIFTNLIITVFFYSRVIMIIYKAYAIRWNKEWEEKYKYGQPEEEETTITKRHL